MGKNRTATVPAGKRQLPSNAMPNFRLRLPPAMKELVVVFKQDQMIDDDAEACRRLIHAGLEHLGFKKRPAA